MPIAPGNRVGPYEIEAQIGAGGMGEVYRAHDSRLHRKVAIKVMPPGVSSPDRIARFEQEARAAAALNHANIVAVYDIGQLEGSPYIVSELLDGETLQAKLRDGALPMRKALDYAAQIAQGLAAAHARGIIHRDLKPANVFVTTDGHAKILDFGLAKLAGPPDAAEASASLAATAPVGTAPGMVFGTVGYMAPEQVRGATVDHRADIFAFGVLLYEMVTGTPAFARQTPPETMTAILKDDVSDVPLSARQAPIALTRILRRCLDKEPSGRFQSALDLGFAITALDTASSGGTVAVADRRRPSRETAAWVVAAAATLAAVAAVGFASRRAPATAPGELVRFSVPAPEGWSTDPRQQQRPRVIAVSPDGRRIAFMAVKPGMRPQLFIRDLDSLEVRPVTGSEGSSNPVWSPDGRWLAFSSNSAVRKVAVDGGQPLTICDCQAFGGYWTRDDQIYLGVLGKGLVRLSSSGGPMTSVVTPETGELYLASPVLLDDQAHLLFTALGPSGRVLKWAPIDGGAQKIVAQLGSMFFAYARGHVITHAGTSLTAQRFNDATGTLEGTPITIVDRLWVPEINAIRTPVMDAANDVLAYQTGPAENIHALAWFDRAGKRLELLPGQGTYSNVELAPDGSRAALAIVNPAIGTRDIWTFMTNRPVLSRFTTEPTEERSMAWTPDSRSLIFNSGATGHFELWRKSSSGIGAAELIFSDGQSKDPLFLTPDSGRLFYRLTAQSSNDIYSISLRGEPKATPFLNSRFDENYARLSPDGKWMAYVSDESGQREVYVVSFPTPANRIRVTTNGGDFPRWRGDGRELFFIAPDSALTAVTFVPQGAEAVIGAPQRLFATALPPQPGTSYAVSPDGQRFLMIIDTQPPPPPITVVLNWTRLLGAK